MDYNRLFCNFIDTDIYDNIIDYAPWALGVGWDKYKGRRSLETNFP